MKNAHDLILDYLHKHHAASAAELSEALQLTKADVRYHLKRLLNSKTIERAAVRRSGAKGRPTQVFRIAQRSLPDNFASLAEGLLTVHNAERSDLEFVEKLANLFAARIPHPKLPAQQLNRLVAFLTEHGYMARWEAYASGPRILFRNCPYAQILPGHLELCTLDAKIISNYLAQPFEQTARFDPDYAKIPACVFTLKKHAG